MLFRVGLESTLSSMYYTWLKRFAREFGKSLINSAWKCVTAFCLCRTFWERVKVQVMEGSHVRKKYFGHWLINPYPPLTALLSKGSLFTDLATCRDPHWVVEIPLRGALINALYPLQFWSEHLIKYQKKLFFALLVLKWLSNLEFWRPKKKDQVARIGVREGGGV